MCSGLLASHKLSSLCPVCCVSLPQTAYPCPFCACVELCVVRLKGSGPPFDAHILCVAPQTPMTAFPYVLCAVLASHCHHVPSRSHPAWLPMRPCARIFDEMEHQGWRPPGGSPLPMPMPMEPLPVHVACPMHAPVLCHPVHRLLLPCAHHLTLRCLGRCVWYGTLTSNQLSLGLWQHCASHKVHEDLCQELTYAVPKVQGHLWHELASNQELLPMCTKSWLLKVQLSEPMEACVVRLKCVCVFPMLLS